MFADHPADSEDMFADTRMTFGEHLEDLRTHLWRAIAGFCVAMVLSLFIGRPVLKSFIIEPVEKQLGVFYDRRYETAFDQARQDKELREQFKPQVVRVEFLRSEIEDTLAHRPLRPVDPDDLNEASWSPLLMRLNPFDVAAAVGPSIQKLGPRPSMKTMNITEAFMVYFKISIACGLVLASPWIFWQLWSFVAAGLYPHEKHYVHLYLPVSLGLFLVGVFVCQFLVLPKAIEALLWFNEWIGLEPDLRLNEWLSFAIWMPIVFGISFQTPLVMYFLNQLGIMDVETYRNKRKMAFFVLAIFAALITPSIDALSMFFLWGPLCLLYQLGIWMCVWLPRREQIDDDGPDSEEMIGV